MVGEGNVASDFRETFFLPLGRQQQDECLKLVRINACPYALSRNTNTHATADTHFNVPAFRHAHSGTNSQWSGSTLTQRKTHLDPHAGKGHKLSHTPLSHTPTAHGNSCIDRHIQHTLRHTERHFHTLASSLGIRTESAHLCQAQCHFFLRAG